MYKIHNFFRKLKRAFGWFMFFMKSPHWFEYDLYGRINIRALNEMASYFEEKDITTSALTNAAQMKQAAEGIETFLSEKHLNEYLEAHWDDKKVTLENDFLGFVGGFDESYSTEDANIEADKDQIALEQALFIIQKKMKEWWM